MPAQFLQPVEDDPPADPQHGDGPHHRQEGQQFGHSGKQSAPDSLRRSLRFLRQMQTDIIHLHDQRHGTIDQNGNPDAHKREDDAASDQRLCRHLV